jgi:hypothetical protein
MQITGLSLDEFTRITDGISKAWYDGNIIVDTSAHPITGTRCRARLRCRDSHGKGARRSWTGRRMPAACWHAYRDVMAAVFAKYPKARIATSMAVYNGRAGFQHNYPGTANKNIGSIMAPAYMPELCDC